MKYSPSSVTPHAPWYSKSAAHMKCKTTVWNYFSLCVCYFKRKAACWIFSVLYKLFAVQPEQPLLGCLGDKKPKGRLCVLRFGFQKLVRPLSKPTCSTRLWWDWSSCHLWPSLILCYKGLTLPCHSCPHPAPNLPAEDWCVLSRVCFPVRLFLSLKQSWFKLKSCVWTLTAFHQLALTGFCRSSVKDHNFAHTVSNKCSWFGKAVQRLLFVEEGQWGEDKSK